MLKELSRALKETKSLALDTHPDPRVVAQVVHAREYLSELVECQRRLQRATSAQHFDATRSAVAEAEKLGWEGKEVIHARKHGLAVVEDCAHATGAAYRGEKIGRHGDIAVYSFHSRLGSFLFHLGS